MEKIKVTQEEFDEIKIKVDFACSLNIITAKLKRDRILAGYLVE